MTSEGADEQMSPFAITSKKQLLQVAIISIIGGMILWLLSFALTEFVFKGFCAPNTGTCADAKHYAHGTATILVSVIILFGFVKLAIFRPLLVVVAATASLWGILSHLEPFIPATAILIAGLLYGFAFLAFTWLARIKLFWLALLAIVSLIVTVRFVLIS